MRVDEFDLRHCVRRCSDLLARNTIPLYNLCILDTKRVGVVNDSYLSSWLSAAAECTKHTALHRSLARSAVSMRDCAETWGSIIQQKQHAARFSPISPDRSRGPATRVP